MNVVRVPWPRGSPLDFYLALDRGTPSVAGWYRPAGLGPLGPSEAQTFWGVDASGYSRGRLTSFKSPACDWLANVKGGKAGNNKNYYLQPVTLVDKGTKFVRIPEEQTRDDMYVQIFKVQEEVKKSASAQTTYLPNWVTLSPRLPCVLVKWRRFLDVYRLR